MGTIAFTLIGFFLISIIFTQYAFAEGQGMSIFAKASEGSTIINVSGHTATTNNAITIDVIAPNGNLVSVSQVMPDQNGDFMTEFQITSAWNADGMYTITAQQGSSDLYKLSVNVEIVDGKTLETAVSDSTFTGKAPEGDISTAERPGLTISADAIAGSTIIGISGQTDRTNSAITIAVTAPNGDLLSIDQIMPDADGDYRYEIETGGALWRQDGYYTIEVQQGESSAYKDSVQVEIVDGAVISSGYVPTSVITVSTNKSFYRAGEMIEIFGQISNLGDFPISVTLRIIDPDGNIVSVNQVMPSSSGSFSIKVIAGGAMKINGEYEILAQYGFALKATTTFEFGSSSSQDPMVFDITPPKILQPKDITVDATDSRGAVVRYDVLAIDDVDEIVRPFCRPLSGSSFPIGDTTVACSATDSAGNSAGEVSFTITVKPPAFFIPNWVKEVAAFWCNDNIDDAAFIEGIQYLIDNEILIVEATSSGTGDSQEIPSWVKNNACWWSLGSITDEDFALGLEYLIGQGIIRV